jgi:hypothetical protein
MEDAMDDDWNRRFLGPDDMPEAVRRLMLAGWPEDGAKEGARMVCCGLKGSDNLHVMLAAENVLQPRRLG